MTEVIATLGLPGSGKSYWAERQEGYACVNRDLIRVMLWSGVPWSPKREAITRRVRDNIIMACLELGQSVIVHDTNFGQIERLKTLARRYGAQFRVEDFTDVPIELCIERDYGRGVGCVGEEVIRNMAVRNGLLKEVDHQS